MSWWNQIKQKKMFLWRVHPLCWVVQSARRTTPAHYCVFTVFSTQYPWACPPPQTRWWYCNVTLPFSNGSMSKQQTTFSDFENKMKFHSRLIAFSFLLLTNRLNLPIDVFIPAPYAFLMITNFVNFLMSISFLPGHMSCSNTGEDRRLTVRYILTHRMMPWSFILARFLHFFSLSFSPSLSPFNIPSCSSIKPPKSLGLTGWEPSIFTR